MYTHTILALLVALLSPPLVTTISTRDTIMQATCDAHCYNIHTKPHKSQCIRWCLSRDQKPGSCQRENELSPWDAACLSACTSDSHCPGTLKCCKHSCGATCQIAHGLSHVQGLPPIPQNITVWEKRRGRIVRVKWDSPVKNFFNKTKTDKIEKPILYVLEERHHVGRHFLESRLGEWTSKQRSQRSTISLKNVVKPGRWYQFRVAAVNENGTRGFSEPSSPFTTSHGPRPPGSPQHLTVQDLHYQNGTLRGFLQWKPPTSSDLPIYKYKVYWSRRLQGVDQDLNSVLVHHNTVNKDQNIFELKGLQPKSLYFLQVQALAQFGATRLKSEKSGMVLNTTNYINDSISLFDGGKRSADQMINGLQLQKIYWNKNQLFARIVWKPVPSRSGKPNRYAVEWKTGQCESDDKGYQVHKQIEVITEVAKLDLYDLNFRCKYIVRVRRLNHNSEYNGKDAVFIFKTPSCQQLQLVTKKEKIRCN